MRKLSFLRWCFLVLIMTFMATLWQGTPTTYAANGSIIPSPYPAMFVPGLWTNSNAAIVDTIPPSYNYDHIRISDQSYLRVGWVVKIDNELMSIRQLIEGGYGQPDTMVVYRAQGGTVLHEHAAATNVKAHTVTFDIWAQNVSDPAGYGFAAFEVDLTFPPDVQFVNMTYDSQWLSSTGRYANCFSVTQDETGAWQVSCYTENNPQYGQPSWYPPGPSGSGRIARVTVLPQPSGFATISLAGSYLLNVAGTNLSATMISPKVSVVECPDANVDGEVNVLDVLQIGKNIPDTGVDSGATINNAITASETQIAISDQSRLQLNDTIAIANEQMSVQTLLDGSPDMMSVVRGVNATKAATHPASAHIYRATADLNFDGKKGYTPTRDINHDGALNVNDVMIVAKLLGITCPASP